MGLPLTSAEEVRANCLQELDILDSSPEASFDNLTSIAARLFQVPIVLISFLDRDRQWFKSHHGLDVCETPRDVSFCAYAVADNEMLVIEDATRDVRFANNPLVTGEPNIRFYAGTPLRTRKGCALGTICLIDVAPRSFSEEERGVLRDMADLVMDELELRLSRKRLEEQDKHWRALIAGTSDLITVIGAQGLVIYQSPAITDVLGYWPYELIGRQLGDFIHPDEEREVLRSLRLLREVPNCEQRFEFRFRHSDGSWRDMEIIGKNCLQDKSVQGIILTSRDVTESKRMQERLRLLESVVINTNDVVIVTDFENIDEPGPRIIYVNEAFTETTGYTAEEAIGRSPRFLQGPQTQRQQLDVLRDALEAQRSATIQVLNYRKNGEIFWSEMSVAPVVNENGQVTHWISIQRDITQSKEAADALQKANDEAERSNQALRESSNQLQLALGAGHMGTWEHNYLTGEVRWSPQTAALYGFRPGEPVEALSVLLERLHPDDRQAVEQYAGSPRTSAEFIDEFRVVWPDGSLHWLENRGRLVYGEDGSVEGTVGIVLDITERKFDLEGAQLETLKRLALAAEYRDDDTGLHTQRVGRLSHALAEEMGLPQPMVQLIGETAPLHDVGKIGVSDSILLKPGRLTEDEFATMKLHTRIGAGILSGSTSPWLKMAEEIALTHHERWDGLGYTGLKGEEIPLVGCIVCVADVFDALTHKRPYKNAWTVEEAVAEITSQSGRQFNPHVVEAFLKLNHEEFL